LTYRLAEKGGEETLEKRIGKRRANKVYKKFEKQGGYWVFGGSILPPPFPIVPVLMAAGVLAYPKRKFLMALALGRAIRYFLLAWVAHVYGISIIGWLSKYYKPMLYTLIGSAVLGSLGLLVYLKWYRPRKKEQARVANEAQRNGAAKRRVA
jgi:membrane protein DedA with SNARE-associated domain